jgi:hypothetical protein
VCQEEIARRFLQVSAAYLYECAYCVRLRTAFARSAARDAESCPRPCNPLSRPDKPGCNNTVTLPA